MTGSNIFSFVNTRRRTKLLKDGNSAPSSTAYIKHGKGAAANDASRSPHFARNRRLEQRLTSRPSLASINTCDAEGQCTLSTSADPESLRNSSARPGQPAALRTLSNLHKQTLHKEQSSCTLHSYYDRNSLPLAVSQQTSASAARDFALRKGCPPVISTPSSDVSSPQKSGLTSSTSTDAAKKRPKRLDFSLLFPKPLPRSGLMLSPKRYTDSPPPLSAASEMRFSGIQPQSFLNDKEATTSHNKHGSCAQYRKVDPSFMKTKMQRPSVGVHNWFDGLEGDISEDDADREPDMQPDFVETAFPTACGPVSLDTASRPIFGLEKDVWLKYGTDHQPWDGKPYSPASAKWDPVGQSQRSASTSLDLADLHEESVLCLSSSEDEDDNVDREDQCHIFEQRESFLRNSIGVDSVESDVETGTEQVVQPSNLGTLNPPTDLSNLRDNPLIGKKSKVPRLTAVKIPHRRGSRQAVPRNEHQMLLSSAEDGVLVASSRNHVDHEASSSKHSTTTTTTVAQRHSPLVMALTSQEASLLEAMRSKRALIRQNTLTEDSPSQSPLSKPPIGDNVGSRCIDNEAMRLDAEGLKTKKSCPTYPASTEPNVPSGQASLTFSESVSSPTTGLDSPATPTLESNQGLNYSDSSGEIHHSSSHVVGVNPSHTRCGTRSSQMIVLDSFRQADKESITSNGYPWVSSPFIQRINSAMIH